jgi:hypothetical protein
MFEMLLFNSTNKTTKKNCCWAKGRKEMQRLRSIRSKVEPKAVDALEPSPQSNDPTLFAIPTSVPSKRTAKSNDDDKASSSDNDEEEEEEDDDDDSETNSPSSHPLPNPSGHHKSRKLGRHFSDAVVSLRRKTNLVAQLVKHPKSSLYASEPSPLASPNFTRHSTDTTLEQMLSDVHFHDRRKSRMVDGLDKADLHALLDEHTSPLHRLRHSDGRRRSSLDTCTRMAQSQPNFSNPLIDDEANSQTQAMPALNLVRPITTPAIADSKPISSDDEFSDFDSDNGSDIEMEQEYINTPLSAEEIEEMYSNIPDQLVVFLVCASNLPRMNISGPKGTRCDAFCKAWATTATGERCGGEVI